MEVFSGKFWSEFLKLFIESFQNLISLVIGEVQPECVALFSWSYGPLELFARVIDGK